MKVTKYLPILAVCLMTTGCNSKKEAVLTSGIDLANWIPRQCRVQVFISMPAVDGLKVIR